MKLSDFDYALDTSRIAQKPAEPRDSAKLLDARTQPFGDHSVRDLPGLLRAGDLLVVNNTKVIPAKLTGQRKASAPLNGQTGGQAPTGAIHVTLHQRIDEARWWAFIRPARKCQAGTELIFGPGFEARIDEKKDGGEMMLSFSKSGPDLDAALLAFGSMPLPPYIKRDAAGDQADNHDYQTLFARHSGAVAAPTAGLHFTDGLRDALAAAQIDMAEVTLHVGAGTFLPVQVENIADHKMHAEWGAISEETVAKIDATKAAGGRIISVGTTSLRILEAAYAQQGKLTAFSGETDIFITPGFQFGVVDMLMTNFHLPKSTLLMLVSALTGKDWVFSAYDHALAGDYRFFSYGDACLFERKN